MTSLLILEDDILLNRLYIKALTPLFDSVYSAHSVEEALRVLDQTTPTMAMLDMTVTDGTGLTILEQIRKKKLDTYAVVVTGESKYEQSSEIDDGQFFLYKPVSIIMLRELMGRLLGFIERKQLMLV